ncbi:MAG: ral secretion pathway protein [Myxococcaceae bacterium]|nr:ral secretion pathway protein [Myxococcaceae bacterium]
MRLLRGQAAWLLSLTLLASGPGTLPSSAQAQDGAAPRTPSRPVPLTTKGGAGGKSAADAPPVGDAPELPRFETGIDFKPTNPATRITFNLEDAELTDLVRLISSITGKAFIIPNKARQIKATVFAPEKVTAAEAYRAFLSILELNGMAIVPSGRYLKIVESQGVEAKTIPLLINENVPQEDRFMTYLHRANFVNSDDLAGLLTRFKSPEGNVTSYAPTNTVIMTDTGNNIRRQLRIAGAVDVERGGEQLWIEPIHHANATELSTRLGEIFPVEKVKPGQPPPPAPGKPGSIGGPSGNFRVTNLLPDERTNSLIIMATEAAYLRILQLIRELDVPLDGEGGIHVHYLQHGDAEEIAKTLSTLIGGSSNRAAKNTTTTSGTVFEGQIAVTAHKPTNSLVITSSLHDYGALKKVIDRLDTERRQVYIEAVVLNLDVTKARTTGVSYFTGVPNVPVSGSVGVAGYQTAVGSLTSGAAGLLGSVTAAGGADALTGLALGVQGPAINATGVSIPSFGVALAAIASSGDSDVLATPHLLALNNEEAEINIGQNVPLQASVPGAGLSQLAGLGGLGGAQGAAGLGGLGALGGLGGGFGGTVPRGDVGTRIRLTPHINESDEIRLDIDEEISDVGAALPNSNVGAVPINKRTAKTKLVVRDQQTVVIGGLMRDGIQTTQSKIPLLGDIPLIGALFRKTTVNKQKSNLLLFLTPYIVRSQADLRSIYERKMRERQEFLDRYFVFGTHDYHPTVDYSRTRGLVAEIMKQVEHLHADKRVAEDLASKPTPEHVPRKPVGGPLLRKEEQTEPSEGDTVIEGGNQTSPAAPAPANPDGTQGPSSNVAPQESGAAPASAAPAPDPTINAAPLVDSVTNTQPLPDSETIRPTPSAPLNPPSVPASPANPRSSNGGVNNPPTLRSRTPPQTVQTPASQ